MGMSGFHRRANAVALLLLSAGVVGAPAAALAQTPAPVKITKCSVLQYNPVQPVYRRSYWYDYGFGGPVVPQASPYTDGIEISFTNLAHQVADRVVIGVDYRGDFQHVVDAGKFSPNVSIDHTFADIFSGYAFIGSRPNSCSVRAVRFVDGSTWHAPGRGEHRQAM